MSPRRLVALLPLAAVLALTPTLVAPADAAVLVTSVAPDPVASVAVGTQSQVGQGWSIPISWDAAATATGYRVKITNLAGTENYGTTKDVAGTSTTVTTSALLDNTSYLASVVPFNADGDGSAVTEQFTAAPLDHTAPSGTFTVAPAHAWLVFDLMSEDAESATVTVTQVSASDASGTVTKTISAGDGTAAKAWGSGNTFDLHYTHAGTFTPTVDLADAYGNHTAVALSAVTIGDDVTAPTVAVTLPAASLRDRVAGWRRVRGTASDTGSGVEVAFALVLEQRGGIWYAYDFHHRKWLKGSAREGRTLHHTKAMPAIATVSRAGTWVTPRIRGLQTGKISVHSAAFDAAGNIGLGRVVRHRITGS